jgi:hypothetical protein
MIVIGSGTSAEGPKSKTRLEKKKSGVPFPLSPEGMSRRVAVPFPCRVVVNMALLSSHGPKGPWQPKMDAERVAPDVKVTLVKVIGTVKLPPPTSNVPLKITLVKVVPLMVTKPLPRPLPVTMVKVPNELPAKHGVQFRAEENPPSPPPLIKKFCPARE